ncbi:hypothetical protein ACKC9G_15880 [Pokkaliibacter sp. CJK22405]|uniref:hypothetical protein n=1 Tax=Pokkaliibacter sp. CJK22405 TaxID=3384615 RepID=UPI003984BE57
MSSLAASAMNGMSSLGTLGSIGSLGSSKSLEASQDAMQQMDEASATATKMNAQFQSQKMITDTVNSIANGMVDSASKANNAATQSGKAINY